MFVHSRPRARAVPRIQMDQGLWGENNDCSSHRSHVLLLGLCVSRLSSKLHLFWFTRNLLIRRLRLGKGQNLRTSLERT